MSNKFIGIFALAVASLSCNVVAGENLLKNGDGENGQENWSEKQTQVCTANPHSGKSCLTTIVPVVISEDFIEVVPDKAYKVGGWFRSADGKPVNAYLGLAPFDKDKKPIESPNVLVIAGTETELVEDCLPACKILKVKDGSKWTLENNCGKYGLVAFNIDDSGKYLDLPNRELSAGCGIEKIEKKDGCWEISLKNPCGKIYRAGTKVREHRPGANYMYKWYQEAFQSKDWIHAEGTVKGIAVTSFWPGTKYVKVVVMGMGGKLNFDDMTFEEIGNSGN